MQGVSSKQKKRKECEIFDKRGGGGGGGGGDNGPTMSAFTSPTERLAFTKRGLTESETLLSTMAVT